jgi:hypothetical protein
VPGISSLHLQDSEILLKNKLEVEMKGKKFAIVALLAVALVVVGVLVWPTPKQALAIDKTVQIFMTWDPHSPDYDVDATAQLLDCDGDEVGNPIALAANGNNTIFTGTFNDVPSYAYYVVFGWDVAAGYQFVPEPFTEDATVLLNWSGITVLVAGGTGNAK